MSGERDWKVARANEKEKKKHLVRLQTEFVSVCVCVLIGVCVCVCVCVCGSGKVSVHVCKRDVMAYEWMNVYVCANAWIHICVHAQMHFYHICCVYISNLPQSFTRLCLLFHMSLFFCSVITASSNMYPDIGKDKYFKVCWHFIFHWKGLFFPLLEISNMTAVSTRTLWAPMNFNHTVSFKAKCWHSQTPQQRLTTEANPGL